MHAKFVLIENDKFKVAIRSSMNLNANKTCELFEIDEGDEIYDFLMQYVLHTFENMEAGFIEDTGKVMGCVNSFFNKKQDTKTRNWWEITNKTE